MYHPFKSQSIIVLHCYMLCNYGNYLTRQTILELDIHVKVPFEITFQHYWYQPHRQWWFGKLYNFNALSKRTSRP